MDAESRVLVRVSRRFRAAPERVFDAWLDPERARRWLFATEDGEVVRADIDARAGGRFVIVDRRGGEDVEHAGEYLEMDRPRRLVFTFGADGEPPESSRVTVEIAATEDGCELTLSHEMDARWAEYRERTEAGWTTILAGLDRSLENATTEAGSGLGIVTEAGTLRFERALPGPVGRVWAWLTESEKRGRWLATGEMDLRAGGRVRLDFMHADLSPKRAPIPERHRQYEGGATVHGRVTRCEPPRLLGFTWEEAEGYDSEVTFELDERDGGVLLTVTHRRLRGRSTLVDVAAGWHTHLDILADRLEGKVPEPFWTGHSRREAEYEERIPPA